MPFKHTNLFALIFSILVVLITVAVAFGVKSSQVTLNKNDIAEMEESHITREVLVLTLEPMKQIMARIESNNYETRRDIKKILKALHLTGEAVHNPHSQ